MKNKKRKKEFAKNKFGPKFDFGFFVFSFFNAESKNRFSVFGLKRKKEKGALFPFFLFSFWQKNGLYFGTLTLYHSMDFWHLYLWSLDIVDSIELF